jgi:hypothetical protein
MFDTLSIFPLGFWVVIGVLVAGVVLAKGHLRDASGLPTLAVLGTVCFWYVGDAFYNDYAGYHAKMFTPGILQSAWWQVAWFLVVFLFATPFVHRWFNARHLHRTSGVLQMFQHGIGHQEFQKQLTLLLQVCGLIWAILTIIALVRLKGAILYYFFPFLGYNPQPWGRGRLGKGFDSLLSVAFYLQQFVAAIFGIVAALSTKRSTRLLALAGCLLSWPNFIFDRTRNVLLSVVVPGILSWTLLRLRGGVLKKAAVLSVFFLLVNAWLGFVIANRSDMSIVEALKEKGFSLSDNGKVHHEGLNMYEELCWINTFVDQGIYNPNWGSGYFADLVSPIPRVLWPGKPMGGIDYAIARGVGGADEANAGVYATISTGLIGQGVVNFGPVFGPLCAALLMGLWVAMLARLDLQMNELGRLPLYCLGLILTFNLGRDIIPITLYPFVFGVMILYWVERNRRRHPNQLRRRARQPVSGTVLISGQIVQRSRTQTSSITQATFRRSRQRHKPQKQFQ